MARRGGQGPTAEATVRTRRHRPDVQIVLYMGLLMMLGLVVMFAIGPQRANVLNAAFGTQYGDTYFFVKQVISIGVALAGFVAMALIPYEWVLRRARLILFVGIAACGLLMLADVAGWGIAQNSYGATRWFNLGSFGSLQPSEILKFGVWLYLAVFFGVQARRGELNNWRETIIPAGIIVAVAALIIVVIQRDLGTGLSMAAIVATMLFVAGINARKGAALLAIGLAAMLVLIVSAPHRVARVLTFVQGDSTSTDDDSSYHIEHAKIAIGTGGFFGVGIGNSVQATGYLPEAINDSVFAIMGETFGFVGLVATIALFVALLMRLLRVMDHLVDVRLKLVAAGVFGWFGAHVILNIGAMIGIIPLTGITLPLLSFGGTSMLFVAAALGFVFQLSRYTVHTSTLTEGRYEHSGSRRGVGRTRHTSRGSTARAR